MEDDPRWTMEEARKLADQDQRRAVWVRWACVAAYVAVVAVFGRNGVTDAELIGATIAGATLVGAFLSAGWICGGSWRD